MIFIQGFVKAEMKKRMTYKPSVQIRTTCQITNDVNEGFSDVYQMAAHTITPGARLYDDIKYKKTTHDLLDVSRHRKHHFIISKGGKRLLNSWQLLKAQKITNVYKKFHKTVLISKRQ
ncbi:hypothetical protein TNCV_2424771 [Trichonephila clavipes]|nr:hypothetical protein TNCV_2424771 [Trichonephila clavipes]